MTEALFLEAAIKEEQLLEQGKRRLNVSGVLKILGVSRSGYLSWKKRLPSKREKRKRIIKERIIDIYKDSHQNYGAPKITECLRKEGEIIAEKTVGNYMRELGIKAQYVKPYTVTTINSDFSNELKNILEEQFNNTIRIHSHCGYLSPNEYESSYWDKLNKMERKEARYEAC